MKYPSKKVFLISAKTNGRCFYCNKCAEVIDHFISRKKWEEWELNKYVGNTDHEENLFPACFSCNSSKRDKCPEDFMKSAFTAWSRYMRANKRIGIGGGKGELDAIWGSSVTI